MDTSSYDSPGKWFNDARGFGYRIPAAMMHGICKTMEKLSISFPEAYKLLKEHEKIFLVGKTYVFNLDYEVLEKRKSPFPEEEIQDVIKNGLSAQDQAILDSLKD